MSFFTLLFEQRIRGFRLIEVIGFGLAVVLFMWVTVSKALVRDDVQRLEDIKEEITVEQEAVNSLRVKVAALERPSRLEALAKSTLGLKPVEPERETDLDALPQISKSPKKAVVTPPAPNAAQAPLAQNQTTAATAHPPVVVEKPVKP